MESAPLPPPLPHSGSLFALPPPTLTPSLASQAASRGQLKGAQYRDLWLCWVFLLCQWHGGFLDGSGKNPPANAGDTGDAGSIPGLGSPCHLIDKYF